MLVLAITGLLVAFATPGCKGFSKKQAEAKYGPTEGILEAVAVLRRHVPDDTYRFPPATDFSGRNVYRASLLRLENLERAEADAVRSGYMDVVISFAKARALERIRAYSLASSHYGEAERFPGELREPARVGREVTSRLADALTVGMDLRDPLADESREPLSLDIDSTLGDLDERVARLSLLLDDVRGTHYQWIVQEEIERADMIRARYFEFMRFALEDGTVLALQQLQRVVNRHGASKNRLRHLLSLGDFYAALSREYLESTPPESIRFDPPRFQELVEAALRLYEVVASHDGTPEKLEASRSLEAFLALTLSVDADRFDR